MVIFANLKMIKKLTSPVEHISIKNKTVLHFFED